MLSYLSPDDFRPASLRWFTKDLPIPVSDLGDTELTDVIAAMSASFDAFTNDHFEPEPGGSPEGTTTLLVSAGGGTLVYLPRRIRSLTSVEVRDPNGNYLTLPTTAYGLSASVSASVVKLSAIDRLSLLNSAGGLSMGGTTWPSGPAVIRLTGTFSWPEVPPLVQRAVALMVWDAVTPEGDTTRRAMRVNTLDASYEMGASDPTGIRKVDEIIAQYRRRPPQLTSIRITSDLSDRVSELEEV